MFPAGWYLGRGLPARRWVRSAQWAGVAAMLALAVSGMALVLGLASFEASTTASIAAWTVLCGWLVVVNRDKDVVRRRTARLGRRSGAAMLAGELIAAVGLALPAMSPPQVVVLGAAAVPGVLGFLGIPLWWLLVAHDLAYPAPPTTVVEDVR
jgi:hypothetical protein